MALTVPPPRSPLDGGAGTASLMTVPSVSVPSVSVPTVTRAVADAWARWYEEELGWSAVIGSAAGSSGGTPADSPADFPGRTHRGARVWLPTGLRFDVLTLPDAVGRAVLRRVGRTGPVAVAGGRVRLWVAAGSADELPGLLDWLEWGGIALDLTATGAGGRITAPPPPGRAAGSPGAAGWLRPPEPRRDVEPTLPALAALGSRRGTAPDFVRLVDAAAAECHRVRLTRTKNQLPADRPTDQPLAFS
ncbi:SCO3374 family protein [Streptomyces sp. AM 4-1-1]|uniref:SCO3374 family protein n=1 Tax=Streptomyces sp. AM 4-1-1 TaxID=3028710 RepID=UPI0023B94F4C|nr:SCO3374 family protein [Streptomyces sp. AM 4-1-1]WEH34130.1 SCO3374 family protein [Streptomyces sp. AM 4-1-1]